MCVGPLPRPSARFLQMEILGLIFLLCFSAYRGSASGLQGCAGVNTEAYSVTSPARVRVVPAIVVCRQEKIASKSFLGHQMFSRENARVRVHHGGVKGQVSVLDSYVLDSPSRKNTLIDQFQSLPQDLEATWSSGRFPFLSPQMAAKLKQSSPTHPFRCADSSNISTSRLSFTLDEIMDARGDSRLRLTLRHSSPPNVTHSDL